MEIEMDERNTQATELQTLTAYRDALIDEFTAHTAERYTRVEDLAHQTGEPDARIAEVEELITGFNGLT